MLGAHCYVNTEAVVTAITSKWRNMDEVAKMSLCISHFPVVALHCAVLPHKPRRRHQNLKNTNSNKACGNVFTANYPQKVSKCSHFPSVFSHKIDSQHVSQAVFWAASHIRTNVVVVGVMCWSFQEQCPQWQHTTLGPGVEKTTYSLSHTLGPQHYLHCVHLYNPHGNYR